MALFLSTFVNKIDKKGRISVPATFRSAVATQSFSGIVAYRSFTAACIEGGGMDRMERLSEGTDELAAFSSEQDNLTKLIFADARQLAFDKEGRVMLPDDLVEHAGLSDTAAFVGLGKTFQIWNPEAFKAAEDEARKAAFREPPTLKLPKKGGEE